MICVGYNNYVLAVNIKPLNIGSDVFNFSKKKSFLSKLSQRGEKAIAPPWAEFLILENT